jgi:hypothetical protein
MNRQTKESRKFMISAVAALLLSVKNTVIDYQAKLFPFAKGFLGLCLSGLLLVSCASGQKRAGNIWWADYTQNSREDCAIDGRSMGDYWFNDTKSKTYGYQIPQGQHNVEISTRWSNGFVDSTQLTLDVKEGGKYTFHTYELQEGQDPNAPVAHTEEYKEQAYKGNAGGTFLKDVWEITSGTILITAILITSPYTLAAMPVVLPAIYLYDKSNKVPKHITTNTEAQPTDSAVETVTQPPDLTPDTETKPENTAGAADTIVQSPDSAPDTKTKPEETVVTKVSQPVEPPPAPTARPFDGCCYVWIEDSETKEVVAGTRLPGAGK